MGKTIRFILNGETVEVSDLPPNTTLLNWLRYRRQLTGTKEGCAEGDCGACTVAVRELGADGELVTKPLNACILLLPMLHGKEVITVERLASPEGALHPVQAALSECHGSQCGLRDEHLDSLPDRGKAGPGADQRSVGREPVPLHRLWADHPGDRGSL
jgi:xanthine dehydrogenase small subunit